MAQDGVVHLYGNLDPTAQEFWPTYPAHFPYLLPPPPPPPPPPPFFLPPPPQPQPQPQQGSCYIPPTIPTPATTPTRAIVLSAVPHDTSESTIRRDLEHFGDVRSVQMDRVRDGIVTVHFYDVRSSHAALVAVRDQHMQHQHRLRLHFTSIFPFSLDFHPPPPPPSVPGVVCGRAVWAHFTVPVLNAYPDGVNQGTIVIFNLDPTVSAATLRNVFKSFGAVKELRETPMKRHQRFVEFYDVRDAAKALAEMNGKEINGKSVVIEYSRPGGHFNKLNQQQNYQNHHNYTRNVHDTNRRYHPDKPHSPTMSSQPHPRTVPFRHRKSYQGVRRGCRSSPSSEESVETAAISKLTLNDRTNNNSSSNSEGRVNGGSKTKGNDNGPNSNPGKPKGARPWKGRLKNYDPRYLIREEAIIVEGNSSNESECVKDTRTTVMIKNIPNKYSQKLLLNMLDNHCIHCNEQISGNSDQQQPFSAYDFVYLPIDFNNKCNVGYGFVNMTSPEATLRLHKAFHHQHWEVFNSRKICEVTYARVQGLEALKEHFKNSKFACENDEYLPVVFTPPRDGRNTPAPLPIVFSTALTPTSSSTLHLSTDIYSLDFTSTTSTVTHPSSDDFDHDQVHPTNDNDNISQTSFDGGDVINAINDNDNDDMIDGSSKM
ncbi:hypothetical protein vseg_002199 [Gypsophila vaccaria]